ncbi:MAG: hypothetical protein V3S30_11995, partial [Thermoanaerobaculia bacterium]
DSTDIRECNTLSTAASPLLSALIAPYSVVEKSRDCLQRTLLQQARVPYVLDAYNGCIGCQTLVRVRL